MTKALLVVEMPSKCESCQFVYYRPIEEKETVEYFCALDFHEVKELAERKECPLKPMPMRKMSESVIYANGKPYQRVNTFTDYDIGWNECIDEILGEEE